MLDAHANLCLLASEEEKVNLGFCEQFHIAIAMSESGEFSCKPMKGRQLMGGFQRGGETGSLDPAEKSPKIGFLSILVRFPLKSQSYQVSIPLGYQSAKRPPPPPPPPPDKTFWLGNHFMCEASRANNNSTCPGESGGFDLRHHAVLETFSAADNISWQFGPQIWPDKMFNVFIDKTVRCAGRPATSLVLSNEVGVHTSTDVW